MGFMFQAHKMKSYKNNVLPPLTPFLKSLSILHKTKWYNFFHKSSSLHQVYARLQEVSFHPSILLSKCAYQVRKELEPIPAYIGWGYTQGAQPVYHRANTHRQTYSHSNSQLGFPVHLTCSVWLVKKPRGTHTDMRGTCKLQREGGPARFWHRNLLLWTNVFFQVWSRQHMSQVTGDHYGLPSGEWRRWSRPDTTPFGLKRGAHQGGGAVAAQRGSISQVTKIHIHT